MIQTRTDPAVSRPLRVPVVGWLVVALGIDLVLALLGLARPWVSVLSSRTLDVLSPDHEATLITLWSVVQLVLAIVLCLIAATRLGGGVRIGWIGLAVVLVVILLDEFLQLHERANEFAAAVPGSQGENTAWVIPAAVAALVIGAAFIPFLVALPRVIAGLLCLSGLLFLVGAAVLEFVGAWFSALVPDLGSSLEEAFEMAGVTVLIFAALRYLSGFGPLTLNWERDEARASD